MKAAEAISEVLKREGVEMIIGYPVNHILEFAARADIRPIIAVSYTHLTLPTKRIV